MVLDDVRSKDLEKRVAPSEPAQEPTFNVEQVGSIIATAGMLQALEATPSTEVNNLVLALSKPKLSIADACKIAVEIGIAEEHVRNAIVARFPSREQQFADLGPDAVYPVGTIIKPLYHSAIEEALRTRFPSDTFRVYNNPTEVVRLWDGFFEHRGSVLTEKGSIEIKRFSTDGVAAYQLIEKGRVEKVKGWIRTTEHEVPDKFKEIGSVTFERFDNGVLTIKVYDPIFLRACRTTLDELQLKFRNQIGKYEVISFYHPDLT